MPWQLPQEDIDTAWGLINRKTLRWELRHMGGSKLAIDEVRHGRVFRHGVWRMFLHQSKALELLEYCSVSTASQATIRF